MKALRSQGSPAGGRMLAGEPQDHTGVYYMTPRYDLAPIHSNLLCATCTRKTHPHVCSFSLVGAILEVYPLDTTLHLWHPSLEIDPLREGEYRKKCHQPNTVTLPMSVIGEVAAVRWRRFLLRRAKADARNRFHDGRGCYPQSCSSA